MGTSLNRANAESLAAKAGPYPHMHEEAARIKLVHSAWILCAVTVSGYRNVTAAFTPSQSTFALTVNVAGNGVGTVVDSNYEVYCPGYCTGFYAAGSSVTLSALPTTDATFTGWAGCDSVSGTFCTVDMTSARSATASFAVGSVELRFVPVTPCRVADTRDQYAPDGGPSLNGNTTRDFPVYFSNCGLSTTTSTIPVAYSLNFTVVPHGSLGYLTVWPSGATQPLVSTLNSLDGRIKANAAIVPAGIYGDISTFVTDDTDLIIDINGYL